MNFIDKLGGIGSNVSLQKKMIAALAVFAVCVSILTYRSWSDLTVLAERSSDQLREEVQPIEDLKYISDLYAVNLVDASHKVRNGNATAAEGMKLIADAEAQIPQRWASFLKGIPKGAYAEQVAAVKAKRAGADKLTEDLKKAIRSGDNERLDYLVKEQLYQIIDPLTGDIGVVLTAIVDKTRTDVEATEAFANLESTIAIVVGGFALLIVGVIGAMLQGGVVRPVATIADELNILARDPKAGTISYTDRGDEIGLIAQAAAGFQGSINRQNEEISRQIAEVENFNGMLSDKIAKMAAGDLRVAIKEEVPAQFNRLRTDFNEMLGALGSMLRAVGQSSESIRTGAHEIGTASEDLARRTESSAASLQQTSCALGEMNARLQTTADAARKSVQGVDNAIGAVTSGRDVAEEAVRAMGGVSESAEGIDEVIEGLDKIAFQTRVLAMNAAVEAGRAGEAGRGFAVVADLVSALAMRAEEQAKQAREQLTSTQTDIQGAVQAVQRVGSALESIFEASEQARTLASQIASESEEQAVTIQEITSAISSMDMAVQQNAAMVEQSSAATRSLLSEVDELAASASRFELEGGRNSGSSGPKSFVPQGRMGEFS